MLSENATIGNTAPGSVSCESDDEFVIIMSVDTSIVVEILTSTAQAVTWPLYHSQVLLCLASSLSTRGPSSLLWLPQPFPKTLLS